jgi:RHS repeat-associated protein
MLQQSTQTMQEENELMNRAQQGGSGVDYIYDGMNEAQAMNKSGFLYIWVSNETQGWDVFFDNLSVQYKQGPLLEENHYYPFGLTMAGISDKAIKLSYSENKSRFNEGSDLESKEFADANGLELYDAGFRRLDPQLGRFLQIDPLSDKSQITSPYAYGSNNPTSSIDPSGLLAQNPQTIGQTQAYINRNGGGGGSGIDASMEASDDLSNMGMGSWYIGSGANAGFWSTVMSAFGQYGTGDSWVNDGNQEPVQSCPLGAGDGSYSFHYEASLAGDNTDLDQDYHSNQSFLGQLIVSQFSEDINRDAFIAAFTSGAAAGGTSGELVAQTFLSAYLNGDVGSTDVTSFALGNESAAGQHILNSPQFQAFANSFENEFKGFVNDANGEFEGDGFLGASHPDLSGDLFLHTIMGGYQYLQAAVYLTDSQITFQYTFTDHFGAGVSDSGSMAPGVPSMYYNQHTNGSSSQYTPFVWSVSVTTTVPR